MSYYNYFTEIEDEFVKRRGSHILVSPLDWSLIETWRQLEIPLSIVLRGINVSFDTYDRLPKRGRKVNSLLYCQQEVEALYQQYCESRVGSSQSDEAGDQTPPGAERPLDSPFGATKVAAYLDARREVLHKKVEEYSSTPLLAETLGRAVVRLEDLIEGLRTTGAASDEQLEAAITRIEQMILDGLQASLPVEETRRARREAEKQLKNYRDGMGPEIYEQTLQNYLAKRWRDQFEIPRLSLFYM